MEITIETETYEIRITTEHSASSYGIPVVLFSGELADPETQVHARADKPDPLSFLSEPAAQALLSSLSGHPQREEIMKVLPQEWRLGKYWAEYFRAH